MQCSATHAAAAAAAAHGRNRFRDGILVALWVAWWRNGRVFDLRSEYAGSGRSRVTTVGKSFTPACLDADSLRYCMESLNGYLYLSVFIIVGPQMK